MRMVSIARTAMETSLSLSDKQPANVDELTEEAERMFKRVYCFFLVLKLN